MTGEEQVVQGVVYATGLLFYLYVAVRVFWICILKIVEWHFKVRVLVAEWVKGVMKAIKNTKRQ